MNIDMYNMDTMERITLGKLRMLADEDKPEGKSQVLVKMSATLALKFEEGGL